MTQWEKLAKQTSLPTPASTFWLILPLLALYLLGSADSAHAAATPLYTAQDFSNHWAFKPPVKPIVPTVKNEKWVRNPIDAFVMARLEKENIEPNREADKITLLRRLSLDLIGVPPTVGEENAFLADHSKHAYEKQVERLLASPHYGERRGRHWLDVARYADSDGYEKDMSREMFEYRDWVINAFNNDKPYDHFIIEQFAGDQLPNATQDQVVATGYLRNSMVNEEGGVDPEQFRMEAMFDRMDAVGKGVLGLTIQCAQCHNHKFDPLKQEEYYRMFAFLNNDNDSRPAVYSPDELMKISDIRRGVAAIERDLRKQMPDWKKRMAEWEKQEIANETPWEVLNPEEYLDPHGDTRYEKQTDFSILNKGYAPIETTTRVRAKTSLTNITGVRLETLTDPNLPFGGPGRSYQKGTFGLSEFKVFLVPPGDEKGSNRVQLKISNATADFAQPEGPLEAIFYTTNGTTRRIGPIKYAIDGNKETAWTIDAGPGQRNVDHKAVFVLATNLVSSNGVTLSIDLQQLHGGHTSDEHLSNLVGKMRFSVTSAPNPVADPTPKEVRDILPIPEAQRTPAQRAAVFSYFRKTMPQFAEGNAKIAKLMDGWPLGASALTLSTRAELRETHILTRGDSFKPDRVVTPGVPAFLNQLPPNAPLTRLTFAKWLVDRKSPTTARVFINRLWQEYFGIGLVSTPEDFGMRAETPSHPELLDWLACEFMDQGWSVKAMQRLIVESATYRESSRLTPVAYELDPYNRLLARGARFRVEGETVHDIALAVSGLLTPQIGGPSIYAPAPAFLFKPPASYGPFEWIDATGPDRYRRAIYTFRRRSTPFPPLQNFDAPNGESACVRRTRSDTPLQALTTLNEPVFVEAAQALALRALKEGGNSDRQRADYVFQLCTARKPTAGEEEDLLSLLKKEEHRFDAGELQPAAVAFSNPEKPPTLPEGTTAKQAAAWTMVSRVVLNLDETITRE